MYILVHHEYGPDSAKAFRYFYDKIRFIFPGRVALHTGRAELELFGVIISFRCGDKHKCAGLRPNYFYADTEEARIFISQSAVKCNGKELMDISEIFGILIDLACEEIEIEKVINEMAKVRKKKAGNVKSYNLMDVIVPAMED